MCVCVYIYIYIYIEREREIKDCECVGVLECIVFFFVFLYLCSGLENVFILLFSYPNLVFSKKNYQFCFIPWGFPPNQKNFSNIQSHRKFVSADFTRKMIWEYSPQEWTQIRILSIFFSQIFFLFEEKEFFTFF